jgi:hypothetical protein
VSTGRIFLAISLIMIGFQDFFFGTVCAHGRAGAAGLDSGAVSLDPSGSEAYRALGRVDTTMPKNAARDVRGLLVHRELGRKRAGASCASARPSR